MNIVIVSDMFATRENGTSTAYKGLAKQMVLRGHKVTVVAPCKKDFFEKGVQYIATKSLNFGPVNKYIDKVGVYLAGFDKEVIEKAIKNADVVHLLLPFWLSRKVLPLLFEQKIPFTSACHVLAENGTSHVKMDKVKPLNYFLTKNFVNHFYRYVHFAHAPSILMKEELERYGAKCDFRVITNGVREMFCDDGTEKPKAYANKFVIMTSGRFGGEKRQDIIIKAIAKSRHKNEIKYVLAGQGPLEKKYKKLIKKTGIDADVGYLGLDLFSKLYKSCDLYIQASDYELEGISCLEGMSCGRACLFSDSKRAAMRFYGNEKSLFKARNPKSLADKIDYYFEHEQERLELGKWYANHAKQFNMKDAMDKMEQMFKDAVVFYQDFFEKHPDINGKNFKKKLKKLRKIEKNK